MQFSLQQGGGLSAADNAPAGLLSGAESDLNKGKTGLFCCGSGVAWCGSDE